MSAQEVLQFKVTLLEVDPPVWRRILVPATYSFWDLHVAIQDAMGWLDYHLHQFKLTHDQARPTFIGIPDEDFPSGRETLPGWEIPVTEHIAQPGVKSTYEYDFGDGWEHEVLLEGTPGAKPEADYPICLAGERACPPEDCGGPYGYAEFLKAIADPRHDRHEELLDWVGGRFDPEAFDPKSIDFEDPQERWELTFRQ